jgi:erythromycin esterase
VVAIGESAHGAHEYYALRHRLARYLVERMNFTALVWESGFPEGFLVDDYVSGRGNDRNRALMDGMTMHMGRCQEMASLVDWLRTHNASLSAKIRFYGLDLPGAIAPLPPTVETVAAYVESVDPGLTTRLTRLKELAAFLMPKESPEHGSMKLVLTGATAVYQYVALSAAERNEITALLADVTARFDALRRIYVERSDTARYDAVGQLLHVAVQLDLQLRCVAAFMSGDGSACEANIRDLSMADTVEWVLSQHQRIVVLAHNGHIQRAPISMAAGITPVDTLGVHLASRLGKQYIPIGTTCGSGEIIVPRTIDVEGSQVTELVIRNLPPASAETIDSLLDTSFKDVNLIDLRTLGPQSALLIADRPRMRVLDQTIEIDVRRAFDMLIHMPKISLWTSDANASLPDLREHSG